MDPGVVVRVHLPQPIRQWGVKRVQNKEVFLSRLLGEIGAIIYVISLATLNVNLLIVSLVLLLIALEGIQKISRQKNMTATFVIAMILDIVGAMALSFGYVIVLSTFGMESYAGNFNCTGPWCNLLLSNPFGYIRHPFVWFKTVGTIATLLGYVLSIISGSLYKKLYTNLGNAFNVDSFKKAAAWIYWGRILSIVFVGIFADFVGRIFLAIGFSNLPDSLPTHYEEAV